jgi:hypothetical protein
MAPLVTIASLIADRAMQPSADQMMETKRLEERKRIEEFYNKRQAAYMADKRAKEVQTAPLKYPWSIKAAGPGFQNLYDVVGLRKSRPEELQGKR